MINLPYVLICKNQVLAVKRPIVTLEELQTSTAQVGKSVNRSTISQVLHISSKSQEKSLHSKKAIISSICSLPQGDMAKMKDGPLFRGDQNRSFDLLARSYIW
ncbi:hypothetical protein ATANTOWER_013489 [Ataeniobius toweri]|uniref:Uncharacterized protein n=1 Tax=Ataeniobius toweri TaxID=208326 RepID=A0ABU7AGX4_9TELE|nr:hypothetical protein [Ataeniobius toweri]